MYKARKKEEEQKQKFARLGAGRFIDRLCVIIYARNARVCVYIYTHVRSLNTGYISTRTAHSLSHRGGRVTRLRIIAERSARSGKSIDNELSLARVWLLNSVRERVYFIYIRIPV